MQDKELAQLTESIVDWIEQPQKYANTLFGEFQSLILQTQEQIYRHIDRRLSIRFS
jgi:hypothetical protein